MACLISRLKRRHYDIYRPAFLYSALAPVPLLASIGFATTGISFGGRLQVGYCVGAYMMALD